MIGGLLADGVCGAFTLHDCGLIFATKHTEQSAGWGRCRYALRMFMAHATHSFSNSSRVSKLKKTQDKHRQSCSSAWKERMTPGNSYKLSNLLSVKRNRLASPRKNASNPPNVSSGGNNTSRTRPSEQQRRKGMRAKTERESH